MKNFKLLGEFTNSKIKRNIRSLLVTSSIVTTIISSPSMSLGVGGDGNNSPLKSTVDSSTNAKEATASSGRTSTTNKSSSLRGKYNYLNDIVGSKPSNRPTVKSKIAANNTTTATEDEAGTSNTPPNNGGPTGEEEGATAASAPGPQVAGTSSPVAPKPIVQVKHGGPPPPPPPIPSSLTAPLPTVNIKGGNKKPGDSLNKVADGDKSDRSQVRGAVNNQDPTGAGAGTSGNASAPSDGNQDGAQSSNNQHNNTSTQSKTSSGPQKNASLIDDLRNSLNKKKKIPDIPVGQQGPINNGTKQEQTHEDLLGQNLQNKNNNAVGAANNPSASSAPNAPATTPPDTPASTPPVSPTTIKRGSITSSGSEDSELTPGKGNNNAAPLPPQSSSGYGSSPTTGSPSETPRPGSPEEDSKPPVKHLPLKIKTIDVIGVGTHLDAIQKAAGGKGLLRHVEEEKKDPTKKMPSMYQNMSNTIPRSSSKAKPTLASLLKEEGDIKLEEWDFLGRPCDRPTPVIGSTTLPRTTAARVRAALTKSKVSEIKEPPAEELQTCTEKKNETKKMFPPEPEAEPQVDPVVRQYMSLIRKNTRNSSDDSQSEDEKIDISHGNTDNEGDHQSRSNTKNPNVPSPQDNQIQVKAPAHTPNVDGPNPLGPIALRCIAPQPGGAVNVINMADSDHHPLPSNSSVTDTPLSIGAGTVDANMPPIDMHATIRPSQLKLNTQAEPQVDAQAEPQAPPQVAVQAEPQVTVQAAPQVAVQAEPQATAQGSTQAPPQVDTQALPQVAVQAEPQVAVQAEPQATAQGSTQAAPQVDTQALPQVAVQAPRQVAVQAEPQATAQGSTQAAPQVDTQALPQAAVQAEPQATAQLAAQGNTQVDVSDQNVGNLIQGLEDKNADRTSKFTAPSNFGSTWPPLGGEQWINREDSVDDFESFSEPPLKRRHSCPSRIDLDVVDNPLREWYDTIKHPTPQVVQSPANISQEWKPEIDDEENDELNEKLIRLEAKVDAYLKVSSDSSTDEESTGDEDQDNLPKNCYARSISPTSTERTKRPSGGNRGTMEGYSNITGNHKMQDFPPPNVPIPENALQSSQLTNQSGEDALVITEAPTTSIPISETVENSSNNSPTIVAVSSANNGNIQSRDKSNNDKNLGNNVTSVSNPTKKKIIASLSDDGGGDSSGNGGGGNLPPPADGGGGAPPSAALVVINPITGSLDVDHVVNNAMYTAERIIEDSIGCKLRAILQLPVPSGETEEDNGLSKRVWINGAHGISKYNGQHDSAKWYTCRTSAATIGTDVELGNHSIIGIAYNYIKSNFKYKNSIDKAITKTHLVSLYGQGNLTERLILQGFVSLGFGNIYTKSLLRNELIINNIKNKPYNSKVMLAHKTNLGNLLVVPNIALKYGAYNLGSYTQSFDTQSLSVVAGNSNRKTSGSVGIETSIPIQLSNTTILIPGLYAEAEKFFHNKQSILEVSPANSSTNQKQLLLAEKPAKYSYKIGGSMAIKRGIVEIISSYNYLITNKKYSSHQGAIKLKLAF